MKKDEDKGKGNPTAQQSTENYKDDQHGPNQKLGVKPRVKPGAREG